MSEAFVPGRIRLVAPPSDMMFSFGPFPVCPATPIVGDLGPICTSGKGGGLGRRGEVDGERLPADAAAEAIAPEDRMY